MNQNKVIIYQLFPRLFTNRCEKCVANGTIAQNGVGKLNDIDSKVLNSIKNLGVNHVWYTGVIEHATKTNYSKYGINPDNPHVVKGNAGSPYAIKDYYDIDPDLAEDIPNRMKEFENLIKRTHDAGLKVIIDFVPNHVARQYHSDAKPVGILDLGETDNRDLAFSPNNNFYYIPRQLFSPYIDLGNGADAYYEFPAKVTGNDCFSAFPNVNDWYETIKLNYGVDYGNNTHHFDPIPNTWYKMLNILRFWASKGVDGFRCDMAHMVPVPFWRWAIKQVKEKYPNVIFIAEIYDVNLYKDYIFNGGFDYLYDKVNLYDTLRSIQTNHTSAAVLTNCWQTIDGIQNKMLNFLENHDEQRIASPQFLNDPFKILPSLIVSSTMSTGPFLIYGGQELGEKAIDSEGFSGLDGRTTIFDYWSMPTIRRWYNNGNCNTNKLSSAEIELRNIYTKILNIASQEKAITKGKFFDLMYVNYENPNFHPHSNYAYLRGTDVELLLIALNFGENPTKIKINIPDHAFNIMGLEKTKYVGKELLTGEIKNFEFSPEIPFETDIKEFSGVIWKFQKYSSKKN